MSAEVLDERDARERYDTDGYVIFRDVIDADLIKEVNAHVEWLQARHPDLRPEKPRARSDAGRPVLGAPDG